VLWYALESNVGVGPAQRRRGEKIEVDSTYDRNYMPFDGSSASPFRIAHNNDVPPISTLINIYNKNTILLFINFTGATAAASYDDQPCHDVTSLDADNDASFRIFIVCPNEVRRENMPQ